MSLVVTEIFDLQVCHQFIDSMGNLIFGQTQRLKDNADIFFNRQFFKNRWFLGQIGNTLQGPFVDGKTGDILTIEQHLTAVRTDKPGNRIKSGGLTGAIGT